MDDLLRDLHVISQIQENLRLNTQTGRLTLDAPGALSGFYRWIRGDSRLNCITTVERIVNQALRDIELCSQVPSRSLEMKRLMQALRKALKGIESLKTTYAQDPPVVAALQVVIDRCHTVLTLSTSEEKHA